MSNQIQYVTDENGNMRFVQIPVALWERIKPRLSVDDDLHGDAEQPEIEDREGILVVKSRPLKDLKDVVKQERSERAAFLIERMAR